MKIYEQFDAATAKISAYAIFKGADYIGRIVVKYPKDGAGRLYVYAQQWGYDMVLGYAGGYGYDKVGAALASAYNNAKELRDNLPPMFAALEGVGGGGQWQRNLESCGYIVHSVI